MSVPGLRVRVANAADLAEVIALERGAVEAPHWAEAEYAAIVRVRGEAEGVVRRCLFVAETGREAAGFCCGEGDSVGRLNVWGSLKAWRWTRRRGGAEWGGPCVRRLWIGAEARELRRWSLRFAQGARGRLRCIRGWGLSLSDDAASYYREPDEDAVLMQLKLAEGKVIHIAGVVYAVIACRHYVKRCLLLEVFSRANWQVYRTPPSCVSSFHPTINARTQPV